ncbi:MAG: type II toxin-antitoxin system RelE/ParE family toxin [Anaerolineae bacterium]|nr:type II toxin-antitoxin system RelE/ParE family toxin [Anaerolineae bacterium]
MSDATILIQYARIFRKRFKQLRKKYPSVQEDVAQLVAQLKNGETPGDRITGVSGRVIYKVKLRIGSSTKGKSGGYRVIYFVKTATHIILINIYVKAEQSDIFSTEILQIIDEMAEDESDTPNR